MITVLVAMRNEFSQDGNRRDVRTRDTAGGREGKRSFRNESYLRDSMEEGPRKKVVGGRPPVISTAGFTQPFRILKGKFPFIRTDFSPMELFGGARLADSSSDGK